MSYVDLAILVLLGGFTLFGLWFGVIHMVGSIVGLVAGAVVSGWYYDPVAHWFAGWLGGSLNFWRFVSVFIVYVLVNRAVGLIFWIIEKIFKFISVIPFLKTFNRLLGAGLGLIEGTFVCGLAVWFAARLPFSASFTAALTASPMAKALVGVGAVLAPLLPQAARALQTVL